MIAFETGTLVLAILSLVHASVFLFFVGVQIVSLIIYQVEGGVSVKGPYALIFSVAATALLFDLVASLLAIVGVLTRRSALLVPYLALLQLGLVGGAALFFLGLVSLLDGHGSPLQVLALLPGLGVNVYAVVVVGRARSFLAECPRRRTEAPAHDKEVEAEMPLLPPPYELCQEVDGD